MNIVRRSCIALVALLVALPPLGLADDKNDEVAQLLSILNPPDDLVWAENLLMLAQFKALLLVGVDAELSKRSPGPDWSPSHPAWKAARAESVGQFDAFLGRVAEGSVMRELRRETLAELPADDRGQLLAAFGSDLGRKLIVDVTMASVAGSYQNYVVSRAADRRGDAPETITLADLKKVEDILRKYGAAFGKLMAEEEARVKALASGQAVASFRELNIRMGGKVLQVIGREIAIGGKYEVVSTIADRAVKRYQDAR